MKKIASTIFAATLFVSTSAFASGGKINPPNTQVKQTETVSTQPTIFGSFLNLFN